jgi:hypothetical protein
MLAAGDRAPDAPIRLAAGQSSRLFSLFKGPHWTLIGWETERSGIAPRPSLQIHVVGALVSQSRVDALVAYLDRYVRKNLLF